MASFQIETANHKKQRFCYIKIMKSLFIVLLSLCFSQTLFAQNVQNINEKPTGIYAKINVADDNLYIKQLLNEDEKQNAISTIIKNPNRFSPPVLYTLSDVFFKERNYSQALFWFYVAQLRARYDMNRCLEPSASGGLAELNATYGPQINTYALQNIELLKLTVKNVIAFVSNNQEDYDNRWINLYGMGPTLAALGNDKRKNADLSTPETEWPEIKRKTIQDYQNGFEAAMASLEKK